MRAAIQMKTARIAQGVREGKTVFVQCMGQRHAVSFIEITHHLIEIKTARGATLLLEPEELGAVHVQG